MHSSGLFFAGLFLLVLLLSIFFASRLRPASRAPVLFRPDTNIQVLLDLKYNLSAEGISCITCSGESAALQAAGPRLGDVERESESYVFHGSLDTEWILLKGGAYSE